VAVINSKTYFINSAVNLSDRRLLGHKRAEQIEAAKQIVAISSLEKQRNMLKTLFTKLFSVSEIRFIAFQHRC